MDAIIDKYGFKEGLTTRKGKITNWPYTEKKPTVAELVVIINEYKVRTSYRLNRKKEYPSIEEQLDTIYKDRINGTHKWDDIITSIKNKYPKSE